MIDYEEYSEAMSGLSEYIHLTSHYNLPRVEIGLVTPAS
jgi:hypothetical protein